LAWTVELSQQAQDDMAALDAPVRRRIQRFIDDRLLTLRDPRQIGEALTGTLKGYWKFRQGDWRMICSLHHGRLVIEVITIVHRSVAYRR